MNKLKFAFVSLFVVSIAVYFAGQSAFAEKKGSAAEVVYNDGTYGLSRASADSVSSQGKAAKPLLAETPIINFHAAYTSYSDLFSGDSYWPFLCPDSVFVFGAFSTEQGTLTGVRVRWKIKSLDDPDKVVDLSHDFTDIIATPDEFWTVWLHIDGLDAGGKKGYVATITVKSLEGYGQKSAKCKFKVIPCDNNSH